MEIFSMKQGWNAPLRRRRWLLWTSILLALMGLSSFVIAGEVAEPSFEPREPTGLLLVPPLPPIADFPVQLVLDDDVADGDVGVNGAAAQQFLWFNQFSAGPTSLEQIWVLFQPGANMAVGASIDLVVYEDADGDPTNGATLLAVIPEQIEELDGQTFSVYNVVPPIETTGGDILIGVVPRFITSGMTSPTAPAAIDTDGSQARSWVAIWFGDPPATPDLPPDDEIRLIDEFTPAGNWMIRGFGTANAPEVPTLGNLGSLLLISGLALLGTWMLIARRRLIALPVTTDERKR
jgi:hypothetical protein